MSLPRRGSGTGPARRCPVYAGSSTAPGWAPSPSALRRRQLALSPVPSYANAGKLNAGKLNAGKLNAGKLNAGKLNAGKLAPTSRTRSAATAPTRRPPAVRPVRDRRSAVHPPG
ncbi:hypothetical protein DLJ47_26970 [Micromonospora sp. S4605]|nr:hypothetical protein DLJ47_26970 [Micromonospora sp. S4605]